MTEDRHPSLIPSLPFANDSEAEFARILDFYKIRWRYETTCFPIRWDDSGRAIEAFTPDFYLPDQDVYIELTTLRQSLTSKKKRKIRLFRELYPDIRLQVLFVRDYDRLLHKYAPVEDPPTLRDLAQEGS
jgi:hypoxanthine phosphoribosyltransferase